MKFRKWGSLFMAGAMALTLAACNDKEKEEGKDTAKSAFLDAHKTVQEAKQVDYSMKVTLDGKQVGGEDADATNKEMEALKDMSLSIDSLYDKEKQQEEAVVKAAAKLDGFNIDFSLPLFMDVKANKMYVNESDFSNILSLLEVDGSLLAPYAGKTFELDLSDDLFGVPTTLAEDMKTQEKIMKKLDKELNALPASAFKKDGKNYTATLEGDTLKTLVEAVLLEAFATDETIAAEDIDAFKEELKKADFGKSNVVVSYEVDGKKVVGQNMAIHAVVPHEEFEDAHYEFNIGIQTTYNSLNKAVKFKMNTTENIVPFGEVMDYLDSQMYDYELEETEDEAA